MEEGLNSRRGGGGGGGRSLYFNTAKRYSSIDKKR